MLPTCAASPALLHLPPHAVERKRGAEACYAPFLEGLERGYHAPTRWVLRPAPPPSGAFLRLLHLSKGNARWVLQGLPVPP